jgi:hypothetical protein
MLFQYIVFPDLMTYTLLELRKINFALQKIRKINFALQKTRKINLKRKKYEKSIYTLFKRETL